MLGHGSDEVIPRLSQIIGSKKRRSKYFDWAGLLKLVYLPDGQKCNKEYFVNKIFEGINGEYNHGAGCRITKTIKIHLDNSRVHNGLETAEKYENDEGRTGPSTLWT
jgi:hypothetical protein